MSPAVRPTTQAIPPAGPGAAWGADAASPGDATQDEPSWDLVVTRTELYLLAATAKAGHVLGIDDPFLGLLDEEADAALGEATRALIERGQLQVRSDGALALAPAVAGLIRANSAARRTLVASAGGRVRLMHTLSRQHVEQEALAEGRLGLRQLQGGETLVDRLRTFFSLPEVAAAPGPSFVLPERDLAEARVWLREGDRAACETTLGRAGIAPGLASSFAGALVEGGVFGSAAVLIRDARMMRYGESVAWLIGEAGGWLVQALAQERRAVRFTPATSEAIWRRIAAVARAAS